MHVTSVFNSVLLFVVQILPSASVATAENVLCSKRTKNSIIEIFHLASQNAIFIDQAGAFIAATAGTLHLVIMHHPLSCFHSSSPTQSLHWHQWLLGYPFLQTRRKLFTSSGLVTIYMSVETPESWLSCLIRDTFPCKEIRMSKLLNMDR